MTFVLRYVVGVGLVPMRRVRARRGQELVSDPKGCLARQSAALDAQATYLATLGLTRSRHWKGFLSGTVLELLSANAVIPLETSNRTLR